MPRYSWRLAATLSMVSAAACRPDFQLKNYTSNETLYSASLREYERRKWDNAVSGFEKLTTDLSARDSLLPRSYWYLAWAHEHIGEHLLAAQSFNRLVESFPEDTLADNSALEAARSYRKMWRKPQLDPQYGEMALSQYNTLIGLYPDSPLLPTAQKEIGDVENWFANLRAERGRELHARQQTLHSSGDVTPQLTPTPERFREELDLLLALAQLNERVNPPPGEQTA